MLWNEASCKLPPIIHSLTNYNNLVLSTPFWTLKIPYLSATQSFTMFNRLVKETEFGGFMVRNHTWWAWRQRETKRQCHIFVEFYPPYISAEEKSYTKQRQCMSSRACHLCDFDLKTHQPTDFFFWWNIYMHKNTLYPLGCEARPFALLPLAKLLQFSRSFELNDTKRVLHRILEKTF